MLKGDCEGLQLAPTMPKNDASLLGSCASDRCIVYPVYSLTISYHQFMFLYINQQTPPPPLPLPLPLLYMTYKRSISCAHQLFRTPLSKVSFQSKLQLKGINCLFQNAGPIFGAIHLMFNMARTGNPYLKITCIL